MLLCLSRSRLKRALCLLTFVSGSILASAQSARPVITKIDPPNWFTDMPDSLLLVHGEHLENTTFTLQGTLARVTETTISTNGHWAFLGFESAKAKPGRLEILASNPRGSVTASYELMPRRTVAEQPQGFSANDVMYLIMPDRFADGDVTNDRLRGFREPDDRSAARSYHGGDLHGIADHLDYLQSMGVTTIWTTPLYDNSASQSGQTYHGYSASDMFAVDPHFGTMADLQAMVQALHARGMKFVLDTVPNHVGPDHPWTKDEPTPDWFHGTVASHIATKDDFRSITDPKGDAAMRHAVKDGWFANSLPDLNQENPLVTIYLIQNAIWWVEMTGADGLRIDTFPYVPRSFWQRYNGLLHGLYPRLTDVGEIFHGDPHVTSFFAGGRSNMGSDGAFDTDLDTPFDYPMFFALRGALTHKKPMTAIADVLRQDGLYPHPERLVTFLGNHDNKRFLSEPGATTAGLHLAFGLLASMRGMPQLYYGDEIGMTGNEDPENRKDFPGGFPKDKANAFIASGRTPEQQSMFQWASRVMQLRAQTPALQTGAQQTLFADTGALAFVRGKNLTSGCLSLAKTPLYVVVVNNEAVLRDVIVPGESAALHGCTRFVSVLETKTSAERVEGQVRVHLPAQEIGIFRAEP